MTTNELRIFISSTFRDLQEEREHLVKKIFPEIRALCRERGVTFTDIDLRWGITEEEAEREGIIHICLDEIDRCRPYFIGILGERYGWVPPVQVADGFAARHPDTAGVVARDRSITEMEILHGVLANPAMAGHAFFYFRDHDATPAEFVDTDPGIAGRLGDLKDRIRLSGFPVRENFRTPSELGDAIERDLRALIDAEFPASAAPSELERQRRAHAAFSASRKRAYVEQPEYRTAFREWLDTATTPLVIAGESGLGKSSLVAYLVDAFREQHPTAFVIEHYVGAAESGGSATAVMRHVVEEIRDRFAIDDPIESKSEELERNFSNWLFRAGHLANQSGITMLVVIDAVNQLDDAGRRLTWLPKTIPAGVRCIVSTTPGESSDRLDGRGWTMLTMHDLDDEADRRRIVDRYLGEFRKSLTPREAQRIATDPKARSPLFLRVVAEELRVYGEHETIDAAIARYTAAADLDGVFAAALERMEHDYGRGTMEQLLGLLWASRNGLSEPEILAIMGVSRLDLSRLLFALDYHLVRREGLFGFFHDYLRRAVEQRYAADERGFPDARRSRIRNRLAEHFEREPVSRRSALELLWQYRELGDVERQLRLLTRIPAFNALYAPDTNFEVLRVLNGLAHAGKNMEQAYREGLAEYEAAAPPQAERAVVRRKLCALFQLLGNWPAALEMANEWESAASREGDPVQRADAHRSLGVLLSLQGKLDEGMRELEESRALFESLGNRTGMASAIGEIGVIHALRGELERAIECHERKAAICEQAGDMSGLCAALGNLGVAYKDAGEFDQAIAFLDRARGIAEDNGDLGGIMRAVANVGTIHHQRGDAARAIETFERVRTIADELGDRQALAIAVGNLALSLYDRGEHELALARFAEAEELSRIIGFPHGLTYWLVGQARGLFELSLVDGPMPPWLEPHLRRSARPSGGTDTPPDVSSDSWRRTARRGARGFAEEAAAVSRDIHKPDMLFGSRFLLARIDVAEGDRELALDRLAELFADATETKDRAELHHLRWTITGTEDDRLQSLRLYNSLDAKNPKQDYRTKITELTEGIPDKPFG